MIFTGQGMTGERVINYFLSTPADTPWKKIIKVFSSAPAVYITYETKGDTVEAEDINRVQDSIVSTQIEVENYKQSNNQAVSTIDSRLITVENNKSEKTYVDTQLLLKADKSNTYTKTETDTRIQNVIGAAPDALDTLKEIADSLNNDPDFAATMTTQLAGKVDKVSGKQLSTEDYTTLEKSKLAGIEANANYYVHPTGTNPHGTTKADVGLGNVDNTSDLNKPISTAVQSVLDTKVNKVTGKGLSTEDFTSEEKNKLDGIAINANNYIHPVSHSPSIITQDADNRFVSDAEKATWNSKQDNLGYTPANKAGDTLTGKLTLPVGTTTEAPLNIPHGVAPTNPDNGDIWVTTGGLIYRINGVTRTVANTASWAVPSQAEAEAGVATSARVWTARRVNQAIQVLSPVKSVAGMTGIVTLGIDNITDLQIALDGKSNISHIHDGVYEPIFNKNTAFNKNFGTAAGLVAEGNHLHSQYVTQGELGSAGYGDMMKSSYDSNSDGKVNSADSADSVPWAGVTGKPTAFPPDTHNHDLDYEPKNTNIQSHIANISNPHSVTKSQVGLGSVSNYGLATQAEAEAGTSSVKYMTPLRAKQAIDKFSLPITGLTWNQLKGV